MSSTKRQDGLAVIYGLIDPITGELKYIGKTVCSLSQRRKQHMNQSKNKKIIAWVDELRANNASPEIFELETVPESQWKIAEQSWIASIRSAGAALLNINEGGGVSNRHTVKSLAIMAEKREKWQSDPKNIERLRVASKDNWKDPSYRARALSAIRSGLTPEVRKKIENSRMHTLKNDPTYRERMRIGQSKVDRTAIAKEFWSRPDYRKKREESDALRRSRGPWVSIKQIVRHSISMTGLDWEKVEEIRRRRLEGETLKSLSTSYSISDGTVSKIIKMEIWTEEWRNNLP